MVVSLEVGDGEGDGVGLGVGLGVSDGVGDGVGDGDGVGEGVGVLYKAQQFKCKGRVKVSKGVKPLWSRVGKFESREFPQLKTLNGMFEQRKPGNEWAKEMKIWQ